MPPKTKVKFVDPEGEIYFGSEYVEDTNKNPLFLNIPYKVQMTNDLGYLYRYVMNPANLKNLSTAEKDFLVARVKSVEYLQALKENRLANKEEPGVIYTTEELDNVEEKAGFSPDNSAEQRKNAPKYIVNNCTLEHAQTSGAGCWSSSLSLLIKSRSQNVPEEIIRAYRSNTSAGELPEITDSAETRSDPALDEKLKEAEILVTDDFSAIEKHADLVMDILPNTAMHTMNFTPYVEEPSEAKQFVAQHIKDTIVTKKSPLSHIYGGHYTTIVGIDDDMENIYFVDSALDPSKIYKSKFDDWYDAAVSQGSFDLNWLEDMDPKAPNVDGFEECAYDGESKLTLSDDKLKNKVSGVEHGTVLRKGSEKFPGLAVEHSVVVPNRVEQNVRQFKPVPAPKITGTMAGGKSASEKENAQAEKEQAEREEKWNYKPKAGDWNCEKMMREIARLNDRLALNRRESPAMASFREELRTFLESNKGRKTMDRADFAEKFGRVMEGARLYQTEKLDMQEQGKTYSSTQQMRLKTINYLNALQDLAAGNGEVTDEKVAETLLAAKLFNATCIASKEPKAKAALCNPDTVKKYVLECKGNGKEGKSFKAFMKDLDVQNTLRTKSSRILKDYQGKLAASLEKADSAVRESPDLWKAKRTTAIEESTDIAKLQEYCETGKIIDLSKVIRRIYFDVKMDHYLNEAGKDKNANPELIQAAKNARSFEMFRTAWEDSSEADLLKSRLDDMSAWKIMSDKNSDVASMKDKLANHKWDGKNPDIEAQCTELSESLTEMILNKIDDNQILKKSLDDFTFFRTFGGFEKSQGAEESKMHMGISNRTVV